MRLTRASIGCSFSLLAACAGYGPGDLKAGAQATDVIARMGPPTDQRARSDGGRSLEYARGPMGKHTYRIEVDAAGRVQSVQQLLTETNFESLPIGAAREAVREQLGRPSQAREGWRGVGEVWFYRYDALPPYCRGFVVWLVDDHVREASYAPDPMCEERRRSEPRD